MLFDRDYMRESRNTAGWQRPPSCIKQLIICNIIAFVICNLGGGGLQEALLLHPFYLKQFQFWRLFTYMFLHGSLIHLFFNMWGIYMFGKPVEKALGASRFLIMYLFSGVLGGLIWSFANWNADSVALVKTTMGGAIPLHLSDIALYKDQVSGIIRIGGGCVGASGAEFGILAACAMTFPNVLVRLFFPPVEMKMRTMVLIYMAIEIFACLDTQSHIAHITHLGGALGGFLFINRLKAQLGQASLWEKLKAFFFRSTIRRTRRPYTIDENGDIEIQADDASANPPSSTNPADNKQELMRVLDKIAKEGYDHLTPEEMAILSKASRDFHNR